MEWKILPQKSDNLIEQLLINRGIKSKSEEEKFFNPKLVDFEKDFKIPGIPKAAKRIKEAIKKGELIIAYGDYDVDGICGAAVLYLGLTTAGAKVLPYIPHRDKEGYGLSIQGLKFARDSGATIVISCDCGIVNFEEAKFAKEVGLDLIITDHHQTMDKLPEAFAIVHSTKLCGTGVAWCLVRTLINKQKGEELLDLVGIATVVDMMPLIGVNRALVKKGLEKLNSTQRVGLLALFNEAGISTNRVTSYEIGYMIGPRLNALGRLEHAIDALRLLCTKDAIKARKLASLIAEANTKRQQLTTSALDEARIMVNGSKKKIHILSSPNWSAGIIGLVAGRVCEETGCSAIVIAVGEEYSKGSARAGTGINIVETIRKCSDILVAVGGHPGAAGFTIPTAKIDEFQKRLEDLMDKTNLSTSEQVLEIEATLEANKLSMDLVKELDSFEPFGLSNPKPVLSSNNMKLSDLRTVGEGKHLKGNIIIDFTSEGRKVPFIAFSLGQMYGLVQNGSMVDLAYNLEIDRFNGYEKLQLKVKDLKVS